MANYSWTLAANGDWNTAADWSPNTVPNSAAADVTIDTKTTLGAYTVTIAAGETQTVNSLTMNAVNNLAGTNISPYNAAELELDGTLVFGAGSSGSLGGSLQTIVHVAYPNNAEIINAGTVNGFIQVEGNLLVTGTNGFYVTNDLQALSGTVTIDTKSIAEMSGNTLFDGIYEAKGPGATIFLGGTLERNIVNIATIQGPPLNPSGWTELTLNGAGASINEWNGTSYVSIETTLQEIQSGGTVDVLSGGNYTTANTLTVDKVGSSIVPGMLNLQAGTVTAAAIDINGGVVQGYGTIVGGVVNNGTLIAVGGTMDLTGSLSGTGTVNFDFDNQAGTVNPNGATLIVNSVSSGQTIIMNGHDTLQIDALGGFAGTIQAGIGDQIVLQGLTATQAALNNGTLVISNGGLSVGTLALAGNYTGDSLAMNGSIVTFGTTVAPTITGSAAGQAVTDASTIAPFAHVAIADSNVGQTETLTVTLSAAANGTLSNLGGGSYNATTGVYTDTGSAAAVTTALAGLLFTPTAHAVAPGQTIATSFTITDLNTALLTATDTTTSVIATAGTVLPTIGGTIAGQTIAATATIAPFAGVTVGDLNFGQTETLSVTLSAAANGTLTNLGGGTYDALTGVYTDTGNTAAVTAALDGLVFKPTQPQAAGQSVTTTFTVSVTDLAGASAINAATSVVSTASAATVPVADSFDGGGTSDILFRDSTTGDTGYLALGSGTWVGYGQSSTAYSIVGVGDFNGDGVTDIMFRNAATGDTGFVANQMGGGTHSWVSLGQSSTAYSVVGSGDFNGDGTADLLFQNATTGDMGVYLLNGSGTGTWQGLGSPSLLYSVVGVGDFTGNGKADILFENKATGDTGYYEVGAAGGPGTWVGLGAASTAYSVVGVGDFTGGGTSDILFRDNATGDTGYLAMPKGGGAGNWVGLGASSTAYAVVGVGDFTGNGVSDILFRNAATGDTGYSALPPGGGPGTWHDLGGSSTAYSVIASPTFG